MVTIEVDQSLSNCAMYEHKSSGNCDDQQHWKDILEASMVSNPEGFSENSPMSLIPYVIVKNCIAIKSLR